MYLYLDLPEPKVDRDNEFLAETTKASLYVTMILLMLRSSRKELRKGFLTPSGARST